MTDNTTRRQVALAGFYGPLQDSNDPARRVGWESAAAQRLRLETLVALAQSVLWPRAASRGPEGLGPSVDSASEQPGEARSSRLEAQSVLDAGCGEGALLEVLRRRGYLGHYRGEDLRQAPILRAQARGDGEWAVADAFSGGPSADIVFCSGALNTDSGQPDHQAEIEAAVATLFARAKLGLVFDIAVADRHHPGVMLVAADLMRLWGFCRGLTPIVSVHEDTLLGEAVFALWRTRAPSFVSRTSDALLVAENLLLAGEAEAALVALGRDDSALGGRLRGQALTTLGRLDEALAVLTRVVAMKDEPEATKAALAQAPLLWRAGQRAAAEAVLTRLAQHDDDARAHLFELQLARKQREAAQATALAVTDPWMRRELMRILDER